MFGCLWKIIRTVLMIIGAITVIMAIVVGVFLWNFSRPTALEKEMHAVAYSEEAVQSFDNKWDDLEHGHITELILSEEEISSKLMDEIGEAGLPINVKDVWVNFVEDDTDGAKMMVAIVGNILGINVHIAGEGTASIAEGENGLHYEITDYDLGRAPESIKNIIKDNIGAEMEGTWKAPDDFPLEFASISVSDGNLVVQGTPI